MHISLKSKLHQDAQRGLYLESAMHIWALSYGLWHVCIFYEAALNHSDKQRYLFNIMPGFHPSIYPFASIFFAAANATARTETKLSLWQPPSSSSWSADAFACSLYHPLPLPRPQPLFLFQSFTKNFFSSYIFSSSHLYQHHMARRIMWSPQWLLPGRIKEKCVSKPIFERSEISPTLLWSTPHFWYGLDVA